MDNDSEKNNDINNSKYKALFTDDEYFEEFTQTAPIDEEINEPVDETLTGPIDEDEPSSDENPKDEDKKKKHKKIIIITSSIAALIVILYFGGLFYYSSHFLPGTYINGIRVGSQDGKQAVNTINTKITDRQVSIIGMDGETNIVSGGEIGLEFEDVNELDSLIKKQNRFLWPFDFLIQKHHDYTTAYSYNQDFLNETVENLSLVGGRDVKGPVDAAFTYNGNEFTIIPSEPGNKPDVPLLEKAIENALVNNIESINLEAEDLYDKPELTENSQIMQSNLTKLNTAIKAVITINFPGSPVTLDKTTFNTWLIANNSGVSLNQDDLDEYVANLANNYNTAGRTYNFRTNNGAIIRFNNINGGFILNQEEEAKQLNTQILNGDTITDDPKWSQAAGSYISGDTINNNYIEVSLTNQMLWLYKNNSMIGSCTIVSGNIATNQRTNTGLYYIQSKNINTNMSVRLPDGTISNREVTYWFPYAGTIGIEGGNWRTSFGNNIYQTQGTDGDIDVPIDMGQTLNSNIDVNYPVVIY